MLRVLATVTLAGLLACQSKPSQPSITPGTRPGVRVPLPAGWSFRAATDRLILVGTPERSVMRIETLPEARRLPTPKALVDEFIRHLHGITVRVENEQAKGDSSLALVELKTGAADKSKAELVLLGAKRLGSELFLCASEPGSSPEEARTAWGACQGIAGAP